MDYWERLSTLKLYSLQRRRERYVIIYVFRILKEMVPNMPNGRQIEAVETPRRGLICRESGPRARVPISVKRMRDHCISVKGPPLFNAVPKVHRDLSKSLESFKRGLDEFLAQVPDEPCLPGYVSRADSNSILDQLRVMRADGIYL